MASNRWASGSIAGVALTDSGGRDLRTDVVDGEPLNSTLSGSNVTALDLTVHTQLISRLKKGVRFGVRIAQIPRTKLTSVVTAMEAALAGSTTFPVILSDTAGTDNISVKAVLDFEATGGKPYQRGAIAAGYVKDVVIRFISTGPHP